MRIDPLLAHHRARVAGLSSWVGESDPTARTAPARAAFLSRFEREVDPENRLSEEDRTRRALVAQKLYFARLTFARVTTASKKNAAPAPTAEAAYGDSGGSLNAAPIAS